MNISRPAFLCMFLAVLAPFTATATEYSVSATLSRQGRALATPTLVLHESKPGMISIAGEDGFDFTVAVNPAENGVLAVSTALASDGRDIASPTLGVRPGVPASVSVGDVAIELTVQEVP